MWPQRLDLAAASKVKQNNLPIPPSIPNSFRQRLHVLLPTLAVPRNNRSHRGASVRDHRSQTITGPSRYLNACSARPERLVPGQAQCGSLDLSGRWLGLCEPPLTPPTLP